jgi:hypothetical protein
MSENDIDLDELAVFEAACPEFYEDHERELLWKGWQLRARLHGIAAATTGVTTGLREFSQMGMTITLRYDTPPAAVSAWERINAVVDQGND